MAEDAMARAKQLVQEAIAAKKKAVKVPGTVAKALEVNTTPDAEKARKKAVSNKRKDHIRLICTECEAEAIPNSNSTQDWNHYDPGPCIACGGEMTVEIGTLDKQVAPIIEEEIDEATIADVSDEELRDIIEQVKSERIQELAKEEPIVAETTTITKIDTVEQFVQAAEQQLIGNHTPVEGMMNMVANSTVAINAYLLSLVRAQAPAVTTIFNQKNKLAQEIFSDDFIEQRTDSEKIGLFKLAQQSFQSDMDFIQTVQDRLDLSQLQAGILAQAASSDKDVPTDNKAKQRVVELIGKLIQSKNQAKKTST